MHAMCDPEGKYLFCLAATEVKTCCSMLLRDPKIMQMPLKDQKTIFIAQKVCHFVGKVEISLYSRNLFVAMLIGFGDTQLLDTFLGKNQVLKVNSQQQLHTQRSEMHSNALGPSEQNFLSLKTTKNARYVRSLRK